MDWIARDKVTVASPLEACRIVGAAEAQYAVSALRTYGAYVYAHGERLTEIRLGGAGPRVYDSALFDADHYGKL